MTRRIIKTSAEPRNVTGVRVRVARADDEAFVEHLAQSAFAPFGEYGVVLGSYVTHPSVFTYVAELDGANVGFIMFALITTARPLLWEAAPHSAAEGHEPDPRVDAEVLAVAVSPEHQSRRVGTRLFEHVITAALGWKQTAGVRALQLNVADTNQPARRFFSKLGFVVLDEHDGVYPNGQRSIRMGYPL